MFSWEKIKLALAAGVGAFIAAFLDALHIAPSLVEPFLRMLGL